MQPPDIEFMHNDLGSHQQQHASQLIVRMVESHGTALFEAVVVAIRRKGAVVALYVVLATEGLASFASISRALDFIPYDMQFDFISDDIQSYMGLHELIFPQLANLEHEVQLTPYSPYHCFVAEDDG
jgi:hypothetical protein